MRRAVAASLLVICLIGCSNSTPVPSEPIATPLTSEQRDQLSPAVLQLLTDVESGKAKGALATNYSAALNEATKTSKTKDGTKYLIILDHHHEAESHPVIVVNVRAADGRIGSCGAGVPCW